MKKLLILILTISSLFTSAQPTSTQSMGTPKTLVKSNGYLSADSGFLLRPVFADTTAANAGSLDQIAGILIRVADQVWMRSNDLTKWVLVGSGGVSGSGGITMLGNSGITWLIKVNDSTYRVDSSTVANYLLRRKDSLTASNPLGYVTKKILADSLAAHIGGSADGKVDSVRWNPVTNTLTVYQDIAADQSVRLPPSYLKFDSIYTPLGGMRNDSTGIIKSIRIRRNSVTVNPTVIGDSAMYWDISVPTTYIDSMRRVGLNWQAYKNGAWETIGTDSVGSGGGGGTNNANIGSGYRWLNPGTQEFRTFFAGLYTSIDSSSNTNGLTVKVDTASMFPALRATIPSGGGSAPSGNFGNIPVLRNGALVVPGSDSLDFDAGLIIKGILSASALPTGGVNADSVVVINSSGAFKKRNVSAFARMNTTSAANQLALFNGNGTLYSSSKFNFSDATYPTMSIIGSDPLIYIGPSATLTNNPSFGSGAGAAIYGGATYKSVQLVDQISGGIQMARFYNSGGTIYNNLNGLIISNTTSSPSNYQGSYTIQRTIPYAVTGLNYHGFTDQTDFRVGTNAFNSFGSFVTIGNNRTSQDHYAAFQTVWYKDSTNRIAKIYDFVSAVSEMRAGTIDTLYRFKVFEASKTGGSIVRQYGIQIDNLSNATTNVGAWIYNNVGIGPTAHTPSERLTVDGNILGTGTIKTADPGSGAGAWKFGQFHSASGLILDSAGYIEVNIGGTVYWLALAATPFPKPNPKP